MVAEWKLMRITTRLVQCMCMAFVASMVLVPAVADQPNLESGTTADCAFDGSGVDSVDLMTGRLLAHMPLPIRSPQRGGRLDFNFALTANSAPWTVQGTAWVINQVRSGAIGNLQGGVGLVRGWDISFHRTIITDLIYGSDTEGSHFLVTSDGATHYLQRLSAGNYMATDDTGYRVFESNPDLLRV
jgi:hypothetical protein